MPNLGISFIHDIIHLDHSSSHITTAMTTNNSTNSNKLSTSSDLILMGAITSGDCLDAYDSNHDHLAKNIGWIGGRRIDR